MNFDRAAEKGVAARFFWKEKSRNSQKGIDKYHPLKYNIFR